MTSSPRLIWITGATSGIGRALALAWARSGAGLILSARRQSVLEEVAQECRDAGAGTTHTFTLDMSNSQALEEKTPSILAEAGLPDILVNNAGISQRSYTADTGMEVYRRIMEVDFFGVIHLSRLLLPHFLERGSGQFVVMSSVAGKFGTPMRSGYCAAKHALHGFFDALRAEYHAKGLRVTILCPAFIQTDVSKNALTADGSPQNKTDEAIATGMAPDKFASKALQAIHQEKEEAILGGREKLGVWLHRFFPASFRAYLRKAPIR